MRFLFEELSLDRLGLFLLSWGTFIAAAAASIVWQVLYNRDRFTLRRLIDIVFPLEGWSQKSAQIDVVMHVVARLSRRFFLVLEPLVTLGVALQISALLARLMPGFSAFSYGFWTIVGCSVATFLICDLASYASHYVRHRVPILWELHKVHHSATFLNPATSARLHPLELVIDRLIITASEGLPLGLFGFLFGFGEAQMLIMVANVKTIALAAVFEELKHSHFAVSFRTLDQVFLSPRMHHVHHSGQVEHFDRNYGDKLSIWDRLFGTIYVPSPAETWDYGLGTPEGEDYQSFAGVYVGPLVKIWRMIAPRVARLPPPFAEAEPRPDAETESTGGTRGDQGPILRTP